MPELAGKKIAQAYEKVGQAAEKITAFGREVEALINRTSMEQGSGMPDFILASFVCDCLMALERAIKTRSAWASEPPKSTAPPLPPSGAELFQEYLCGLPCDRFVVDPTNPNFCLYRGGVDDVGYPCTHPDCLLRKEVE